MEAETPPDADIAELEILEVGAVPDGLGEALAERLSRRVGLPCRLGEAPEGLRIPMLANRNQADADRLLAALEALEAPPGRVRVGVTARDIGHPVFTHFFGRARRGGRALVVSTARLDPTFQGLPPQPGLTLERALLEILHELGHVAGLGHCERWGCVMHFTATVEALDNRGRSFCRACAARLPFLLSGRS